MSHILLIEDNHSIADGIAAQLQIEGHDVRIAGTARRGVELSERFAPDLVLLDLMLPDGDGIRLLSQLRTRGMDAPVLILSALGGEAQKLAGFRAGADDYVTKPFGLLELLARVEALLRRSAQRAGARQLMRDALPLRVGASDVRISERTVRRDGNLVELRPKEWELLLALLRHDNSVVSRAALLREVWGYANSVQSRTVDTHIAELRRKLGDDAHEPRCIVTVRKLGYRLVRSTNGQADVASSGPNG